MDHTGTRQGSEKQSLCSASWPLSAHQTNAIPTLPTMTSTPDLGGFAADPFAQLLEAPASRGVVVGFAACACRS